MESVPSVVESEGSSCFCDLACRHKAVLIACTANPLSLRISFPRPRVVSRPKPVRVSRGPFHVTVGRYASRDKVARLNRQSRDRGTSQEGQAGRTGPQEGGRHTAGPGREEDGSSGSSPVLSVTASRSCAWRGQGRALFPGISVASPPQENRQSSRVRQALAQAILADLAGIELEYAFPGVLLGPIAPPTDLQPYFSVVVHLVGEEAVPHERWTVGSMSARDDYIRECPSVHVRFFSRRGRRPRHVVATNRVGQPVHEDRVGKPVRADNLKRADNLLVQLSSVRVVCVYEDLITDLEGLVDWADSLIEVPLVPSLSSGEGGSDLRDEVP